MPSSVQVRDYSSAVGPSAGEFSALSATVAGHTGQLGTINGQQAVQDGNIAQLQLDVDAVDQVNAAQNLDIISALDVTEKVDATTGLVAGNILRHNGTQFVGQAVTLSSLADVDPAPDFDAALLVSIEGTWRKIQLPLNTSGAVTGDALVFDGSFFVPTPVGGASALSDLTDTSISAPAGTQLLRWNGTAWQNSYGRISELTGDTTINTVGLADNEVLTYSAGLAKWTNAAVPRNSRQLSDVSTTLPSDGQMLSYVSGTGKWTPVAAPSGSISGAADYVATGTVASGDCLVWSSGLSKWTNSIRLTQAEQVLGQLQAPQAAVLSSAGETCCVTYGTNTLPTESATQQATVTDLLYPFAAVVRTSDYIATPVATSITLGTGSPANGSNLPTAGVQSLTGVSNVGARVNYDLGSSLVLSSSSTFLLSLASGLTFGSYRVYGTNDAGAMSDASMLTGAAPAGYVLCHDWLNSLGLGGPTSSTRVTLSQGPFRYISIMFVANGGWNLTSDAFLSVRAAPGGITGQSLLSGDITLTRATSGNPIIENLAGSVENLVVSCERLGLWLLWRDLLTTVTAKGTVRCGGWTIKPGPDLREVQLLNDGYDPASNTTPVAVNRGVALRTSTQGGKEYVIIRPLGVSTGMCMAFNLSATASNEAGVAFMPNVASSAASDVVFALRQNGDVYLAGTVTDSQAGLLGNLNPFA